ncbi:hypothetical protein L6452_39994 [Arctium lappa]|uniref:Uncharacterized protein n=1 Tax=Arctium lappa TaxID=4217 RepID=A0ACB8XUY7_ARCLA|nr:hypothetical protein L6452_39994 [Arctium lappa]
MRWKKRSRYGEKKQGKNEFGEGLTVGETERNMRGVSRAKGEDLVWSTQRCCCIFEDVITDHGYEGEINPIEGFHRVSAYLFMLLLTLCFFFLLQRKTISRLCLGEYLSIPSLMILAFLSRVIIKVDVATVRAAGSTPEVRDERIFLEELERKKNGGVLLKEGGVKGRVSRLFGMWSGQQMRRQQMEEEP